MHRTWLIKYHRLIDLTNISRKRIIRVSYIKYTPQDLRHTTLYSGGGKNSTGMLKENFKCSVQNNAALLYLDITQFTDPSLYHFN